MNNHLLKSWDGFPIQPVDINTEHPPWFAFETVRADKSAWIILQFLKNHQMGWTSFLVSEVKKFSRDIGEGEFHFHELVGKYPEPADEYAPRLYRLDMKELQKFYAGPGRLVVPQYYGVILIDDQESCYCTEQFVMRSFMRAGWRRINRYV